jgi:RNA polymerase sigma factor (TIGR02999 family)
MSGTMNRMPSPDTDEFFGLVYTELRRLAAQHLRRERSNHTLQPTALVHEAYLQLASAGGWKNRAHFFGVASLAMRRVLVVHARLRNTAKRNAKLLVPIDSASESETAVWDFHLLDIALTRLEEYSAPLCRVFEARYFGGLSIDEAAEFLEVSPATVKRRWTLAKAWLYRDLGGPGERPVEPSHLT